MAVAVFRESVVVLACSDAAVSAVIALGVLTPVTVMLGHVDAVTPISLPTLLPKAGLLLLRGLDRTGDATSMGVDVV